MNFKHLVKNIQQTHSALQLSGVKAVNRHITLRNLLIGFYIVEFEQNGEDRAKYGDKLIEKLTQKISIRGLSYVSLNHCRTLYTAYPNILQTVSEEFKHNILQTVSEEFKNNILQTVSVESLPAKRTKEQKHIT